MTLSKWSAHPKPAKRSTVKARLRTQHAKAVAEVRRQVFERDRYVCRRPHYVAVPATDMHEIVFRSQGGEQVTENCIALCHRCHMQIHARRLWIIGTDANSPLQFVGEKPC
jgi:5-methylcytosine-specific restriction endonuclease McrA